MDAHLSANRASVDRLNDLVHPLDDAAINGSAYPTEWSIADVVSHLGSGAAVVRRFIDDNVAGRSTPSEFAPSMWEEWKAKTPRAKVDDGLAADEAIMQRLESLTEAERAAFQLQLGPTTLDFDRYVGLRLNEHAVHVWDVEVVLRPGATVPQGATTLMVDNMEFVAHRTAKPTGKSRTIAVHTTDPARAFTVALEPQSVTLSAGAGELSADLELPAEAFVRLVYGRLDPDHAPPLRSDEGVLEVLRRVFPGP